MNYSIKLRKLALPALVFLGIVLLFSFLAEEETGWKQEETGTYYLQAGLPLTGWQQIQSTTYYFDEAGLLQTGWLEISGQTYFFADDGALQTGWLEQDGSRFYLRGNGSMVTGWLTLDTQRYYMDSTGAARTGLVWIDGAQYLFDETGLLASNAWVALNGKYYYGDVNGHPVTGWLTIDDLYYYFNTAGQAHTGWLEQDGIQYYFLNNGAAAQGKLTIAGKVYHFASNGRLTILTNPWNFLPEDYTVELSDIGSGQQLATVALEDFNAMMDDCRAAGMMPVVISSYRTQAMQEQLYQRRIDRYREEGYSRDEATRLAGYSVAVPGTSEHQLGLALDIIDNRNWNLDESQAEMPTQQWLMENSWRYGFTLRYPDGKSEITGIIYEPWHYRYVGKELAEELYKQNICLEEYLEQLSQKYSG